MEIPKEVSKIGKAVEGAVETEAKTVRVGIVELWAHNKPELIVIAATFLVVGYVLCLFLGKHVH